MQYCQSLFKWITRALIEFTRMQLPFCASRTKEEFIVWNDHRLRFVDSPFGFIARIPDGAHSVGEVKSDDGMYYLTGVFAPEYSFINCMASRSHKSDSPNAAKYAAGGKLARETHRHSVRIARIDDNNCEIERRKRRETVRNSRATIAQSKYNKTKVLIF